jgi:hypothetical protein
MLVPSHDAQKVTCTLLEAGIAHRKHFQTDGQVRIDLPCPKPRLMRKMVKAFRAIPSSPAAMRWMFHHAMAAAGDYHVLPCVVFRSRDAQ